MAYRKMHEDEIDIDEGLVRELLSDQFSKWSAMPLMPVASTGTDNMIYRLGTHMAVRLPRIAGAAAQAATDQIWLPRLAPALPLAIPRPLALGSPARGYPCQWSVYDWLEGEDALSNTGFDHLRAARDLASFVVTFRHIPTSGWPAPEVPLSIRASTLTQRDSYTRNAIAQLEGVVNTDGALAEWEAALRIPEWNAPLVWIHGDLQPLNLLVQDSLLTAVIDFGCLGLGDPAVDLMPAWNLFTGPAREAFRVAVGVDDATWARGRGWAFSVALIALPYYQVTNPALASVAARTIREVLNQANSAR